MSRPRFLADEDLRSSIVRAVRRLERALEITSVAELGLSAASGEEVLEFAWHDRWLIVSHDVNTMKAFAETGIADGRGIHGLLLAPQTRTTRSVAGSLILIWSASDFEEWHDRIVYLPI